MYSNILLPIDLNHEESWRLAAPKAVDMARQSGGEIHALTIIPDFGLSYVSEFFPPDFTEKALNKARAKLDAVVAQAIPSDVRRATHVLQGDVVERILAAAQTVAADVIVLASHQPDTIREFLVGSHADKLVRQSTISVLVVR